MQAQGLACSASQGHVWQCQKSERVDLPAQRQPIMPRFEGFKGHVSEARVTQRQMYHYDPHGLPHVYSVPISVFHLRLPARVSEDGSNTVVANSETADK